MALAPTLPNQFSLAEPATTVDEHEAFIDRQLANRFAEMDERGFTVVVGVTTPEIQAEIVKRYESVGWKTKWLRGDRSRLQLRRE
jgi:hypothetical protein